MCLHCTRSLSEMSVSAPQKRPQFSIMALLCISKLSVKYLCSLLMYTISVLCNGAGLVSLLSRFIWCQASCSLHGVTTDAPPPVSDWEIVLSVGPRSQPAALME